MRKNTKIIFPISLVCQLSLFVWDMLSSVLPLSLIISIIISYFVSLLLFTYELSQNDIKWLKSKMFLMIIVLVVAFANAYLYLSRHELDTFNSLKQLSILDSLYLSVVTFTTTGYGDLYPTTNIGKGIIMSEMILGYIITVFIIAILVSKSIKSDNDYKFWFWLR